MGCFHDHNYVWFLAYLDFRTGDEEVKPIKVHIWHKWWVWGWICLLVSGLVALMLLPWWAVFYAAACFLGPEIWAIKHEPSATPPLTSILRRYVVSWLAFPIIGYMVGICIGAVLYDRDWQEQLFAVGFGVIMWCVEHFINTHFKQVKRSRR